jgi:hypothetical protein
MIPASARKTQLGLISPARCRPRRKRIGPATPRMANRTPGEPGCHDGPASPCPMPACDSNPVQP